jgi:hypothetical protein
MPSQKPGAPLPTSLEKHQTNRTKDIWLVVSSTPLKNMKVTWDDYYQYMEKKHVPNHQSDISREFVLQS